jgi:hypothetical protein
VVSSKEKIDIQTRMGVFTDEDGGWLVWEGLYRHHSLDWIMREESAIGPLLVNTIDT